MQGKVRNQWTTWMGQGDKSMFALPNVPKILCCPLNTYVIRDLPKPAISLLNLARQPDCGPIRLTETKNRTDKNNWQAKNIFPVQKNYGDCNLDWTFFDTKLIILKHDPV